MTYAELIDARLAHEDALTATFGKNAGHFRYASGGHGEPGTALRAAWDALIAADRAHYAQFNARVSA